MKLYTNTIDISKSQLDILPFITRTQDYQKHVYFKRIHISTPTFSNFSRTKYKSISLQKTSGFVSNTL